jgi:hypothetical protein
MAFFTGIAHKLKKQVRVRDSRSQHRQSRPSSGRPFSRKCSVSPSGMQQQSTTLDKSTSLLETDDRVIDSIKDKERQFLNRTDVPSRLAKSSFRDTSPQSESFANPPFLDQDPVPLSTLCQKLSPEPVSAQERETMIRSPRLSEFRTSSAADRIVRSFSRNGVSPFLTVQRSFSTEVTSKALPDVDDVTSRTCSRTDKFLSSSSVQKPVLMDTNDKETLELNISGCLGETMSPSDATSPSHSSSLRGISERPGVCTPDLNEQQERPSSRNISISPFEPQPSTSQGSVSVSCY